MSETYGGATRAELVSRLAPHGVAEGYVSASGRYEVTKTDTLRLVSRYFADLDETGTGDAIICTPGRYHPALHGTMIMAGGHTYRAVGYIHEIGYHILYAPGGQRHLVICAPDELRTPPHSWGWQVQLYAARTADSWGIGDFRDLALICRIAARQGASCVQVSPVHALAPTRTPQDSPYSPASRTFLNILHIAPGLAPGAERVDLTDLVAAGQALNAERLIDRAAVWEYKKAALQRIWDALKTSPPREFTAWCEAAGKPLQRFATWCAIVEQLDSSEWQKWPEGLRSPDSLEVASYASDHADRVDFYAWCQFVAQQQYWAACHSGVDVVADLAVGFDSNSEDAWNWQDEVCFDFEIGAPPDTHNTEGQRWGLPPFNPRLLVNDDFRPFIAMVHSALSAAGALRIDHVMQLWRLYWVPVNKSAANGVYVYYPVDAMLAILRVEAARSNAWVVGEDMGTVAAGVRETMAAIGMLGNRSAMRTGIDDFPELAVGTSSTHDQVTVAGLLTGADVDELNRIGKNADFTQIANTRRGLADMAGIDPDKPIDEITQKDVHSAVLARYLMLANAPSRVVLVSLDDAAMVRERPNMPGTIDVYPNWRLALPQPADEVMDSKLSEDLVALMTEAKR